LISRAAKGFIKFLDSQLREQVGVTIGQGKVLVMLLDQDGLRRK